MIMRIIIMYTLYYTDHRKGDKQETLMDSWGMLP